MPNLPDGVHSPRGCESCEQLLRETQRLRQAILNYLSEAQSPVKDHTMVRLRMDQLAEALRE